MWALAASLPGYAADVTVFVAKTGVEGRLPLTPPADGFEPAAATSSGPHDVEQPTYSSVLGGWGVNFTASNFFTSIFSFIDVTWKNKQTNEERHTFFLVSDTPVHQATLIQVQQGSPVTVDAPPEAIDVSFVKRGKKVIIESATLSDDKKRIAIATKADGIAFLQVYTAGDAPFIIVVQGTPKPAGPIVSTSPTPPGSGGTTAGVLPGGGAATNAPPATSPAGPITFTPGVKSLPSSTDPKTGNTTTGTTKTVSPGPGTTVTTTNTKTATPAGVEVSRSDVTDTVSTGASGTVRSTVTTIKGANGDEDTTEVLEGFDAAGTQQSGAKAVIKVDPVKKTRTTTLFKWDPKTKGYVPDGEPKIEPIASATHPNVYLPETASAGSVVTGTVETQVNEAAAGTVTVTDAVGAQHAIIVGAGGHFLLPAGWVVPGARLTIKDELGKVIANETLHVVSGSSPDKASPPRIDRIPDVLPQGGITRVTGSNLCHPAAVTEPHALLRTPQTADAVPALSSSDRELAFRVPRTAPPGPGSLTVENGAGQTSPPHLVNPVKISVTTPPRVNVGQAFDATIAMSGLTPENRQKTLTATVTVAGNATFVGGQREMRVPIKDGLAKVRVVAQGPGGYEVRVTGISSEAP